MEKKKEEVFQVIMSEMDYYIINRVKLRRKKLGISQVELSKRMGLASGTVGKVENFRERAKYSIRHLNLLAKALDCSPKLFLPSICNDYDFVRLTIRVNRENNKNQKNNKEDYYKVIKVEPLKRKPSRKKEN